jgi:hypothetical protein
VTVLERSDEKRASVIEDLAFATVNVVSTPCSAFPVLAYLGLQSLRIGEAAAVSVSILPFFAVLALFVAKLLEED